MVCRINRTICSMRPLLATFIYTFMCITYFARLCHTFRKYYCKTQSILLNTQNTLDRIRQCTFKKKTFLSASNTVHEMGEFSFRRLSWRREGNAATSRDSRPPSLPAKTLLSRAETKSTCQQRSVDLDTAPQLPSRANSQSSSTFRLPVQQTGRLNASQRTDNTEGIMDVHDLFSSCRKGDVYRVR